MNGDNVEHPKHYLSHPSGVECIAVTEHMNFCVGNAMKYLWRSEHKNGVEDLKKARWYIDREIERLEKLETAEHASEHADVISRVIARTPQVWPFSSHMRIEPEK